MMRENILALIAGAVFALGLILSGMSNPAVVLGFFDVFGQWNAQLIFVMLGAIAVAILPFQWAIKQQPNTWFGKKIEWPKHSQIDGKLISGALIFGIGWGMSGICPAPALVLAAILHTSSLYFLSMFILAILIYEYWANPAQLD